MDREVVPTTSLAHPCQANVILRENSKLTSPGMNLSLDKPVVKKQNNQTNKTKKHFRTIDI